MLSEHPMTHKNELSSGVTEIDLMKVTYNLNMYCCILIFMFIPLQGPQCVT